MSVLVTGGTGVVGRAVLRHLVDSGADVRALVRSEVGSDQVLTLGATPIRGDITDPQSLRTATAGCDVVYHIAGRVEFCSKDPEAMHRVNVAGTRNVVEAARQGGVRRIVHTSSTVTLGEERGEVGSEATVHRGLHHTEYERSKCAAEEIVLAAASDLEVVVVNPSSVQGPGRATGTGKILLDVVNDRLPAMVETPISMVDIDDCARGHLLAATRGVPGQRYVLSGFTLMASEALALFAELTGRPARVRLIPTWLLRPLGPIADVVGRFVDSVPLCAESVRQLRAGARYDGSRATRELGLEYRSARETLGRTLQWFRAEGLTAS